MNPVGETNSECIAPVSGRLFLRQAGVGVMLAGVLHLPDSFGVQEGLPYRLTLGQGRLHLAVGALAEQNQSVYQEAAPFGADALLAADIWQTTGVRGSCIVRFLKAFDRNGWVVLGHSSQAGLDADVMGGASQAWLDVGHGQVTSVRSVSGNQQPKVMPSQSMGQLLRSLVIWPDATGELHTLPIQLSEYRLHHLRKAELEAKLGASCISEQEFVSTIRSDPKLQEVWSQDMPDPAYLEFLAVIKKIGGLEIERPLNRAEFRNKSNMYNLAFTTVSQDRVERLRPRA